MKSRMISWVLAMVFGAACAQSQQSVKPDDMSVAQHRAEADKEEAAARAHATQYDPAATRAASFRPLGPGEAKPLYPISAYNPTETHLSDADRHHAHALEHQQAARLLERFEQKECRDFPPATRAACPLLGPVTTIDDIPGGVRATFAPGTRVDAVVAHMRCHYAYARARAFEERVTCPLYMLGIEIRRARDPMAVEITSGTRTGVEELRARSREEAVFVRRASGN
jgi:hypothetical protein